MKKAINSEGMIVVSVNNADRVFPPGFSYRLGKTIYTVKERVTKDAHAEMRLVRNSDGHEEIMPIESIERDIKTKYCKVLCDMKPKGIKKEAEKVNEKKIDEEKK